MNEKEKKIKGREESKEKVKQKVLAIVRKFVDVDNIDSNTGFFELGVDSMVLMQILAHVNKKFNLDLSIIDLFENYDIEQLANFICSCLEEEELVQDK